MTDELNPLPLPQNFTHEDIAEEAYFLFVTTGNPDAVFNWYAAEANMKATAEDNGSTVVVFGI